ncbi:response regulator [Aequorivita lipolytica]|uniref:Response regulator transcription factor n=1 Tax=Aequorivita lipolytica TaxID=153267 RepID=A0A5C6YTS8_9FLAO|nr:response regulator transcription factor [Aequorivita lipolytica]TXD70868.1 response regulator transcription factor [Aequorivita lipolytica]SRX49921.1 Virulence factors putative positive transcription regulator BvgA [Aequorivita lipolytica]
MKKIVIADHHPVTREGASVLLDSTNEYSIVGKVSRGSELLRCLEKERPDILILELNIPEINGFHALRSIRDEFPKMRIAIFSSHPEEIYALRSIKSGAAGYIPKTSSSEVFLQAIKRIALGGVFLNDELAAAFNSRSVNDNTIVGRYKKLSAREIEVLNLLSNGKRNKDIASLLEINEKTVSTYKTRLLKKLNVTSLAELINQARMFQFN